MESMISINPQPSSGIDDESTQLPAHSPAPPQLAFQQLICLSKIAEAASPTGFAKARGADTSRMKFARVMGCMLGKMSSESKA